METKRKLRRDLEKLRSEFEYFRWGINNPPKFKFGDKVHVHWDGMCGTGDYDAIVLDEGVPWRIDVDHQIYRRYTIRVPEWNKISQTAEEYITLSK